jgi:threonine dehydrogenase-like Zn-dependent dehydrogenase
MKALCWHGKNDVRIDTVPDPKIQHPRDAIVRITTTAICGSDLHLLDGYMPTMESGDVLGHEFMGEIVELGVEARGKLRVGQRVIIPFTIACGECYFCKRGLTSCCDRSNPNAEAARKVMGQSPSGLFGYSHMLGGFAGGQAEYARVPFADFGAFEVPDGLDDEKVVFLTDIFPTGYMAAENAGIEPGDTVAVWGCGPVGQFAIQSCWMFKAGRVIAIDTVPERLRMAETKGRAETIDFMKEDVYDKLMALTNGRGPDRVIDAVGTEAHAHGSFDAVVDKAKAALFMGTDRPHVLRQAIICCRKAGTVSVPGVYIGLLDHMPLGAFVNKGLTMKSGQTHVHRYLPPLMKKIRDGEIDPSFVITHRLPLTDAPKAYTTFRDKKDGCIKVVLKPGMN